MALILPVYDDVAREDSVREQWEAYWEEVRKKGE
jgi:hypothetical protein